MSYLHQDKRQAPQEPSVCITNTGHIIILPEGIDLGVFPVGGGSIPFIRQAYLFNLTIPQLPPGKSGPLTATWINAIGPASFSGPGNFSGYLGPTTDGVVGLFLAFADKSGWGSVYAAPPAHPHQPKGG